MPNVSPRPDSGSHSPHYRLHSAPLAEKTAWRCIGHVKIANLSAFFSRVALTVGCRLGDRCDQLSDVSAFG